MSGGLIIHPWQPQQTRPLPDCTDTGQEPGADHEDRLDLIKQDGADPTTSQLYTQEIDRELKGDDHDLCSREFN